MMFPDRVPIFLEAGLFLSKLVERSPVVIFLQKIDHPAGGNSVQVPEDLGRLAGTVGDDVVMVGHQHIRKYAEAS